MDVTLHFHWLREKKNTAVPDPLSQKQQREFREELLKSSYAEVAARMIESGRFVQTGDLFTVKVGRDDAPKFIVVIILKWAPFQLTAMSGGAWKADDDVAS